MRTDLALRSEHIPIKAFVVPFLQAVSFQSAQRSYSLLIESLQISLILTLGHVVCLSRRWTGFLFFFPLAYQIRSVILCRKSPWAKRLDSLVVHTKYHVLN